MILTRVQQRQQRHIYTREYYSQPQLLDINKVRLQSQLLWAKTVRHLFISGGRKDLTEICHSVSLKIIKTFLRYIIVDCAFMKY